MAHEAPPPHPSWPWRTGRKNPFTIYSSIPPKPTDNDPFVGALRSGALAQRAVDDHNRQLCLPVEAEKLFLAAIRSNAGPKQEIAESIEYTKRLLDALADASRDVFGAP